MLVVTIENLPNKEVEVIGRVKGCIVNSKHIGRDIAAGLKSIVGGELVGYTEMMEEAREEAEKRMINEAKMMGADAIVGVRYTTSSVSETAAEILAYGTAVKIK